MGSKGALVDSPYGQDHGHGRGPGNGGVSVMQQSRSTFLVLNVRSSGRSIIRRMRGTFEKVLRPMHSKLPRRRTVTAAVATVGRSLARFVGRAAGDAGPVREPASDHLPAMLASDRRHHRVQCAVRVEGNSVQQHVGTQ
jgi:hypothetical protein